VTLPFLPTETAVSWKFGWQRRLFGHRRLELSKPSRRAQALSASRLNVMGASPKKGQQEQLRRILSGMTIRRRLRMPRRSSAHGDRRDRRLRLQSGADDQLQELREGNAAAVPAERARPMPSSGKGCNSLPERRARCTHRDEYQPGHSRGRPAPGKQQSHVADARRQFRLDQADK